MAKKYFWLKLKDDFFDKKEIKRLRKIAGGDTYTVIYLKMLLLSLKEEGNLFFDGIGDDFADELSLQLDEEIDNVKMTISYLQSKNLLEVVSEQKYHLNEMPSMVGSETESAERMRRKRLNDAVLIEKASHCDGDVRISDTEIEIEKETEKKSTSHRKQVYDTDSDYYKLASFMEKEIRKNLPNMKKPNLQNWADDFRKIVELDKRDKSEVSRLIRWVQQDDFEMANVLSPSKLRKRYDGLLIKMKNPVKGKQTYKTTEVKPFRPDSVDLGDEDYAITAK